MTLSTTASGHEAPEVIIIVGIFSGVLRKSEWIVMDFE